MKFMIKMEGQAYALLRIVSGFMLIFHGLSKLESYELFNASLSFLMVDHGRPPLFVVLLGVPIEVIGGILIMIGHRYTRESAFICSGFTAVAYWIAHFSIEKILPYANGGELAALYAFVFLFIAAKGAGMLSLDARTSATR